MSAADKRRWQAWFAEQLGQVHPPPDEVKLRAGQGLHLLLSDGEGPAFDVVLAPASTTHPAWHRTEVTSLRWIGYDDQSDARLAWVSAVRDLLPTCEADPGWAVFLQWGLDAKGISVAADRPQDRQLTSGDELVVRLLEPCNAKCDFCACIGVMEDAAHSLDLVRQQLQAGLDRGHRFVSFTGGEPTLLPDLPEHVALAKELGFQRINLQTNGVKLADEGLVQRLAAAGLDQILLSLHSHEPAVHDAVLKLPGAFEGATTGIGHCITHGIRVRLNFVLHRDNLDHVRDYLLFVYKRFDRHLTKSWHGHLGVTLSFVSPIGWTLEHLEIVPRISEAAPKLAEALELAEALGLDVHVPGLCGVPLCTMPGWEPFLEEYRGSGQPDLDVRGYVDACDGCGWRHTCSGYWTKYLELYGTDELGPGPRPWGRPEAPPLEPSVLSAMKQLAARGLTAFRISELLNRKQVRTPRGGRWTDMGVLETLRSAGVEVAVDAAPSSNAPSEAPGGP